MEMTNLIAFYETAEMHGLVLVGAADTTTPTDYTKSFQLTKRVASILIGALDDSDSRKGLAHRMQLQQEKIVSWLPFDKFAENADACYAHKQLNGFVAFCRESGVSYVHIIGMACRVSALGTIEPPAVSEW